MDHLSRISNSPCNELPINDDFSDEKLLAIFREPWFADILNYLVTAKLYLIGLKMMYTSSYLKSGISFGRNCIFSSTVLTKSLGDAFSMKKSRVFCLSVMSLHAVDTLVHVRLLKRCYKVGSTSPFCSKMPINFARRALDAKW